MRTLLLSIISVCLLTSTIEAQRLHVNLFAGVANYSGDLQETTSAMKNSNGALGLGIGYELTERFTLRAGITTGKISGDDKGGKWAVRNLNFTSGILEGHTALEFHLRNPYEHVLTPYIFAGVAMYHYDPFTFDPNGKKVFLRPLSTEGQGFVAGREPYQLTQYAIPFGGGFKLAFSDAYNIGVEVGIRKTNNDYLDDVSTTYVDEALLLAKRGAKAAELAWRGDETKTPNSYPNAGAPRGGSTANDWYYFSGIRASFRIGGGGDNGLGCPRL